MKQGTLIIENNIVTFTPGSDGGVWLAPFEIAHLSGVLVSAVNANIRSIYKSEVLKEYETRCEERASNGNYVELYNIWR